MHIMQQPFLADLPKILEPPLLTAHSHSLTDHDQNSVSQKYELCFVLLFMSSFCVQTPTQGKKERGRKPPMYL